MGRFWSKNSLRSGRFEVYWRKDVPQEIGKYSDYYPMNVTEGNC